MNSARSVRSTSARMSFWTVSMRSIRSTTSSAKSSGRFERTRAACAGSRRERTGGFKWPSQHLDGGVGDGHAEAAFGSVGARRVALAGPARGGAARGPAAVLDGDRGGAVQRGRGGWGRCVVGGGGTMVPGGGRHATIDAGAVVEAALGAVPVVRGTRGGRAVACAGARGAGGRPTARAGGVDDLARAAAQRCDAGRGPGVSRHHGPVARRAGGAASEAGEAGHEPGAAGVRARPAGGGGGGGVAGGGG